MENEQQIHADDDTLLDLDQLNDLDVSGVEEAPDFINDPPKGVYALKVQSAKIEKKTNKEGKSFTRIRHVYSIVQIVELADKDALQPPEGGLLSETFQGTKEGLSWWKKRAKGIIGDLGDAKVGAICAALSEGVSFTARVGTKQSTKEGKEYTNLQLDIIKQN